MAAQPLLTPPHIREGKSKELSKKIKSVLKENKNLSARMIKKFQIREKAFQVAPQLQNNILKKAGDINQKLGELEAHLHKYKISRI